MLPSLSCILVDVDEYAVSAPFTALFVRQDDLSEFDAVIVLVVVEFASEAIISIDSGSATVESVSQGLVA